MSFCEKYRIAQSIQHSKKVFVLSVLAKNILLHYFYLRTPWQQLTYPQKDGLENIVYSSRKISDEFFQLFTKIFPIRLLKFVTTFLFLFCISCQISRKFTPWILPVLHRAPVMTFFLPFCHFPTFKKNWLLGCPPGWMPPGWMPEAVTPSAPPSARHCPRVCLPLVENC